MANPWNIYIKFSIKIKKKKEIKKMLLFNQNEYVVSDFEIDNVNGEAILFNADSKIIITLNSTATAIFLFLIENDKKGKLELNDVVEHQMKTYNTSLKQNNSIYSDTAEAIEKMIDLNILHCTNAGKTE